MAIEIVDLPMNKMWFSIAMLNYQRVLIKKKHLNQIDVLPPKSGQRMIHCSEIKLSLGIVTYPNHHPIPIITVRKNSEVVISFAQHKSHISGLALLGKSSPETIWCFYHPNSLGKFRWKYAPIIPFCEHPRRFPRSWRYQKGHHHPCVFDGILSTE